MTIYNKYWNISGWHIFDLLDRDAHERAILVIGECVTANASINFYNQLEPEEKFRTRLDWTKMSEKKCEVRIEMVQDKHDWLVIASATFLFIRK